MAVNPNAPFGLRPTRHLSGGTIRPSAYHDGIASAYGASIYEGDPVKLVNTGVIETAAAGDTLLGVFVGCEYTDAAGKRRYSNFWPAATAATDIIAYVIDDPNVVFQVQASSAATLANIGENGDIIYTSGTSTNGQSRVSLDETAASSRQLRVVGRTREPENTYGSFAKLEVVINESIWRTAAGV